MKIITALAISCLSFNAIADTTLVYKDNEDGNSMKMMISDNMMRASMYDNGDGYMIYNANTETFTVIMQKQKEYMQFGPKEIEALSDVKSLVMKKVEEQLAQLPASQRAMMKDMIMNSMMSQMPKPKPAPTYSKTGKSSSVKGIDCDMVTKKSEGETSSFCVAEFSDLGMSAAEYGVIDSFQDVTYKLANQFGQDSSMDFSSLGNYVPVKFNDSNNSGVLSEVNHKSIPESAFMIPKGYKKNDMAMEYLTE